MYRVTNLALDGNLSSSIIPENPNKNDQYNVEAQFLPILHFQNTHSQFSCRFKGLSFKAKIIPLCIRAEIFKDC